METDSLSRTFDRDIEDIRFYLSEMFYNEELIYDRQEKSYCFGHSQRKALEVMEYVFIERILMDTGVLREDEMNELLMHLAMNSENVNKVISREKGSMKKYHEPVYKNKMSKMFRNEI